jgi:hypothetical protein
MLHGSEGINILSFLLAFTQQLGLTFYDDLEIIDKAQAESVRLKIIRAKRSRDVSSQAKHLERLRLHVKLKTYHHPPIKLFQEVFFPYL